MCIFLSKLLYLVYCFDRCTTILFYTHFLKLVADQLLRQPILIIFYTEIYYRKCVS